MWAMANSIAKGNDFGDIGAIPKYKSQLNLRTYCSDPYAILGFLELYRATEKKEFLKIAKKVGDNVLDKRCHKGFFVASRKHIYTKFDAIDSLVLLHLYSALTRVTVEIPQALPSSPRFTCPYRNKDLGEDYTILYALTESTEPPISLNEAAATGNLDLIKSLIAKGADVNNKEDPRYRTPLERAVIGGHVNIVKLLIANGADISAKNNDGQTPLDIAVRQNRKDLVELLRKHGAKE
jgi:hypothetical protein